MTTVDSMLTCSACSRRVPPELVAACPVCNRRYCRECGGATCELDHIMCHPIGPKESMISMVLRCPRDHALLKKPNTDPYIENLRRLEGMDWDRRSVDPADELAGAVKWTREVVALAQRCLAIGLTFHPNPATTFGVLGAALRRMQGCDGDEYLRRCAADFGKKVFSVRVARELMFGLAAAMQLRENRAEQRQALMVARQFLRTWSDM